MSTKLSSNDLNIEFIRCLKRPAYAIETYLSTYDNTQKKYVPFNLFDGQKLLIHNYENYRHQIVLKYRQAGISTVTSGYCAAKSVFANPESPDKIIIIANKQNTAKEFLNKIKGFIEQFPQWAGVKYVKNSATHVALSNGVEIQAVGTSKDAFRGFTPTIIIMDEAAFIDCDQDFWSATMAAVATGGKIFLISTPNGQDPIYYANYERAIVGDSDFKITHLKWYNDPRYNKGLRLIKTGDIVDWMVKKEEEREDVIIFNILNSYSKDEINSKLDEGLLALGDVENIDGGKSYVSTIAFTSAQIEDKIREGYKPYSDWYQSMANGLQYIKRDINRELECQFAGSGDNFVEMNVINRHERENVIEPIFKDKIWDNNMWIWEYPIEGHKYILTLDVSRGDSSDYTGMQIIDVDTWSQVAEYQGRIKPDIAAKLVYQYGILYNALTSFDITGGMSLVTIQELKNMGYPKKLFHYDLSEGEMYNKIITDDVIPGIDFGKKNRRTEIVSALEVGVSREEFIIRSVRVINELKKFVFKNGRPDHTKNSHDDLIMPLGMAIFIAHKNFKSLNAATNTVKAMIDAITVISNKGTSIDYSPKDPIITDNRMVVNYPTTTDSMKDLYMKYGKQMFGI